MVKPSSDTNVSSGIYLQGTELNLITAYLTSVDKYQKIINLHWSLCRIPRIILGFTSKYFLHIKNGNHWLVNLIIFIGYTYVHIWNINVFWCWMLPNKGCYYDTIEDTTSKTIIWTFPQHSLTTTLLTQLYARVSIVLAGGTHLYDHTVSQEGRFNRAHKTSFYWNVCIKLGKWTVIYMCKEYQLVSRSVNTI